MPYLTPQRMRMLTTGVAPSRFFRYTVTELLAAFTPATDGAATRVSELEFISNGTTYPTANMTSNTTPSPLVASASGSTFGAPYNAFDGTAGDSNRWISTTTAPFWVQVDLGSGNEIIIDGYRIAPDNATSIGYYPTKWKIEGSNTGSFSGEQTTLVNQQTGVYTGWANSTLREFTVTYPMQSGPAYTTWNPDDKASVITLSNGNLTATDGGVSNFGGVRGIYFKQSGKYYWEVTCDTVTDPDDLYLGICSYNKPIATDLDPGTSGGDFAVDRGNTSQEYHGGCTVVNVVATAASSFDTYMFAMDLDNGYLWWGLNGSWAGSGDPGTGTDPSVTGLSSSRLFAPYFSTDNIGGTTKVTANFGPTGFGWSVPSGFTAGIPA